MSEFRWVQIGRECDRVELSDMKSVWRSGLYEKRASRHSGPETQIIISEFLNNIRHGYAIISFLLL